MTQKDSKNAPQPTSELTPRSTRQSPRQLTSDLANQPPPQKNQKTDQKIAQPTSESTSKPSPQLTSKSTCALTGESVHEGGVNMGSGSVSHSVASAESDLVSCTDPHAISTSPAGTETSSVLNSASNPISNSVSGASCDSSADSAAITFLSTVMLACKSLCPKCHKGKIFEKWSDLAPRETCPECGLNLSKHDNGDGPAVFLVFVLGLVIVPIALFADAMFTIPLWVHGIVWMALTLLLCVVSLRPLKAYIMGIQYRHLPKTFEDTDDQ